MILPSSLVTPEAQLRILSSNNCKTYIRSQSMSTVVDEITRREPSVRHIDAPALHELLCGMSVENTTYEKSWIGSRDDPWLVFHTSGTTGQPQSSGWNASVGLIVRQVTLSPLPILSR